MKILSIHTELYFDYMSDKDPSAVKFFDETGFQLPDSGHRAYGYSPVGEQCIDSRRYLSTANTTLNFLTGILLIVLNMQTRFKVLRIPLNS